MHLAAFIQRRGLLRVFALYSFVSIIGITIVSGYIYFSFLQQNLLQREMTISSEFIQSVSLINKPEAYFNGSTDIADKEAIEEFFNHVVGIPDVFRVKVYDDDYRIIWSNDNAVIGNTFRDNEELDLAYQGRSSFNKTEVDEHEKREHDFLPDDIDQFIESYIPVWDDNHEQVIGVVELYKSPSALFDALGRGRNLVIWVSLLGGLVLYGLLFGVVRIAHRQIEAQRSRTKQASSRAVEINEESLRRISSELQNGPIKSIESAISGLDSQIPELEDLSAREAIIRVIEKHEQNTSTRVGKQIGQIPETLNNATKICIFRLVQEGLRNAYGRGGGIGQYVRVSVKGPQLILSIGEIGHDIDVNDSNNIYHSEDLELRGMRERIESLGGEFYIFSDSRSGGINLRAYLPVVD
jgi:signal transduction histidine kinase